MENWKLWSSHFIFVCFFPFVLSENEIHNPARTNVSCLMEHGEMDGSQVLNLTSAIRDMITGLPAKHVSLLFETFLDIRFPVILSKTLHDAHITTSLYTVNDGTSKEKFIAHAKETIKRNENCVNIIFASKKTAEGLLTLIQDNDLIHRKILHILYWGRRHVDITYAMDFSESVRIAVISNPRPGAYRVYYSQADSSGYNRFKLVNWWSIESGLFHKPLLPHANKVYDDFKGRTFQIPVLHKPPWHFVVDTNGTIYVDGGRDDKLLRVIAEKLNFGYTYVDPPDRIQGSGFSENGTFPGVLGLISNRFLDFFIGDVTITLERSMAVEFSFFTLVDSEIFVTHRPSVLNEALALVRPFHWKVWPPIISLIILYGPILFAIKEAPKLWRSSRRNGGDNWRRLNDCVWFSTATFLRQGGKQPGKSHKVRLVLILMTLSSTYVIGDMYSANLTSLLARPGREKPITTLEQLDIAMEKEGYQLFVEKHGSSFTTLQNGTGIYKKLWKRMQKQSRSVIESVESGMKLVRSHSNVAVLGGRETVYFDTKRFGSYNFHLSEKLNTRYSAIAMQKGCPYIEKFNMILMQLFECGIISKMTEEEYEILGLKLRAAAGVGSSDEDIEEARRETATSGESGDPQGGAEDVQEGDKKQTLGGDNDHQLQPLNTRMLQGAFYMLLIGYFLSGLVLLGEFHHIQSKQHCAIARLQNCRIDRSRMRCISMKRRMLVKVNTICKPLSDQILSYDGDTSLNRVTKTTSPLRLPFVN